MNLNITVFVSLATLVLSCVSSAAGEKNASPSRTGPSNGGNQAALVWPSPPAEARVVYLGNITTPGDLGARKSWFGQIANFITGAKRGMERLVKPFGIALDENDNLCLTDTGANVVCFFDRERKRFQRWEKIGKLRFVAPVAIAKKNGIFYVADSGLQSILAFNAEEKLLFQINKEVERPAGLAIIGEKLFVANAEAHCVAVFGLNGKFLFNFGKRGVQEGEFNFPTHLAADGKNRLFVTDSMNSRVQMFDASGKFLGLIGSLGDGSGHFSRPKGVAVDSLGHVYVADALFDNLQIFDQTGRFLLDVGAAGSAKGEFWMPAGVAISRDNQIYVADSYNCRVQVFKYVGKS